MVLIKCMDGWMGGGMIDDTGSNITNYFSISSGHIALLRARI